MGGGRTAAEEHRGLTGLGKQQIWRAAAAAVAGKARRWWAGAGRLADMPPPQAHFVKPSVMPSTPLSCSWGS